MHACVHERAPLRTPFPAAVSASTRTCVFLPACPLMPLRRMPSLPNTSNASDMRTCMCTHGRRYQFFLRSDDLAAIACLGVGFYLTQKVVHVSRRLKSVGVAVQMAFR